MPWDNNGSGDNKGPWGNNPFPPGEQPDFDELLKKSREKFTNVFSGGGGPDGNNGSNGLSKKAIGFLLLVGFVLWLSTGLYTVGPGEQGVVLRFGYFHRTEGSGLSYHLPSPFEQVIIVPVEKTHRVEVGMRSGSSSGGRRRGRGNAKRTKILEESLMLTGDENIIDVSFEVQWKISSAEQFLFRVKEPKSTIKSVAESAMREIIGQTNAEDALTGGKSEIEQKAKAEMQTMLDGYEAGVEILRLKLGEVEVPSAVTAAFKDVQNAKTDKESTINQAEAYKNDIIPKARGEVEKIIQQAKAYKASVVANAEGKASRFLAVYNKYKDAKEVTKKRIYLETMEKVFTGMDKILIDESAKGSGVVPYLPLPEIKKRNR